MKKVKSDAWDGKMRTLYEVECANCSKLFLAPMHMIKKGYYKYCSRTCMGKASQTRLKVKCSWCEKIFNKIPSSLKKSKSGLCFCSRECKDKAQSIGGLKEVQPPHYGEFHSDYRKIAFDYYEAKCSMCGYSKYKEVLEVHHKDRDRNNNDISNLTILCPTCHDEIHFLEKTGKWGFKKENSEKESSQEQEQEQISVEG